MRAGLHPEAVGVVDGILVQLPLPRHLNESEVLLAIDPNKDVDGFHPVNVGKMVVGEKAFLPCTPHGVLQLLARTDDAGLSSWQELERPAANGRNGSRNLILALTMFFISARRGSAMMLRFPSARGPHSNRPRNQPATRPCVRPSTTRSSRRSSRSPTTKSEMRCTKCSVASLSIDRA